MRTMYSRVIIVSSSGQLPDHGVPARSAWSPEVDLPKLRDDLVPELLVNLHAREGAAKVGPLLTLRSKRAAGDRM